LFSIVIAYLVQNVMDLVYNYMVLRKDINFEFGNPLLKLLIISFIVLISSILVKTYLHNVSLIILCMICVLFIWLYYGVERNIIVKAKLFIYNKLNLAKG